MLPNTNQCVRVVCWSYKTFYTLNKIELSVQMVFYCTLLLLSGWISLVTLLGCVRISTINFNQRLPSSLTLTTDTYRVLWPRSACLHRRLVRVQSSIMQNFQANQSNALIHFADMYKDRIVGVCVCDAFKFANRYCYKLSDSLKRVVLYSKWIKSY